MDYDFDSMPSIDTQPVGPGYVGIQFCQEWYVVHYLERVIIALLFIVTTCCTLKKTKKEEYYFML